MQQHSMATQGDDDTAPRFERRRIGGIQNPEGGAFGSAAAMNLLCLVGDLTGTGRPDIVVAPRHGRMVWFENPGIDTADEWPMHTLDAEVHGIEAGGALVDLTGNGLPDVVAGGDARNDELYWWENPGTPGRPWHRRVIAKTGFWQFHDQSVGVVTPDGVRSLVFWNNRVGDLYRVPLPSDPTVSPWPGIELIRRGNPDEGIAIGDVDGDGVDEIVAGDSWYKFVSPDRGWRSYRFGSSYPFPRLQVADVDGDGRMEIVAAEGDAHIFGKPEGGRAGWYSAGADPTTPWQEHLLEDELLDAHTLQVGDLTGDGSIDILVAEIGIPDNPRKPRCILYRNNGAAGTAVGTGGAGGDAPRFTRHVVDEGLSHHEGRIADIYGTDRLDIVAKPLVGPERWDVFVYKNHGVGDR